MKKPLRALIVEDSEDDAILMAEELRRAGYEVYFERVETPEEMSAAASERGLGRHTLGLRNAPVRRPDGA